MHQQLWLRNFLVLGGYQLVRDLLVLGGYQLLRNLCMLGGYRLMRDLSMLGGYQLPRDLSVLGGYQLVRDLSVLGGYQLLNIPADTSKVHGWFLAGMRGMFIVYTRVVWFLISKRAFSLGFNSSFVFSNWNFQSDVSWDFYTFGFNHFHKEFKAHPI